MPAQRCAKKPSTPVWNFGVAILEIASDKFSRALRKFSHILKLGGRYGSDFIEQSQREAQSFPGHHFF